MLSVVTRKETHLCYVFLSYKSTLSVKKKTMESRFGKQVKRCFSVIFTPRLFLRTQHSLCVELFDWVDQCVNNYFCYPTPLRRVQIPHDICTAQDRPNRFLIFS